MIELLSNIIAKVSVSHLNILFLLGIAVFGGTIGGRLFQKFHIPKVVGYVALGILIGESGLKIVDDSIVKSLQPFSYFALGLVGFMIGGELKKDILRKYGKQFINILLFEGIAAFLTVAVFVGFIGGLLFGNWRISWALGLLLGAIASATAPAATSVVLRECKSRGPLTRTILGIVALDDALALILFAVASSIAGSLIGHVQVGLLRTFINPLYEIFGAVILGIICGFTLNKLLRKYSEEDRILTFSIGAVLLVTGIALAIHVDMLLAAMTLGVIVVNFTPRKSKDVFKLVEVFTPPIYVLFFVLVGAKFNIKHITLPILILAGIYLLGRTLGKAIGANLGARVSKAAKSVQRYLPMCLLSQAGVAIGLSILASNYFPGVIGDSIVAIITATVFILEIIGPALVKLAVTKAGEAGLDITEEDLMGKMRAEDVMDKNPPLIYQNMSLAMILNIFSNSPNLYYPVVDKEKRLVGIITVDNIKSIFMVTGLNDLLLAVDFMQLSADSVNPSSSIFSVRESFDRYNLEYLPVVTDKNIMVGFIERRLFNKFISTKILELQRQADSLEVNS